MGAQEILSCGALTVIIAGMLRIRYLAALVFLLLASVAPSRAEDGAARVGQVVAVDGAVSLRIAGEWSHAAPNDPIAPGMGLHTGTGRATLGFGGQSLTMADSSDIDVLRLDGVTTQIAVRQGRVGLHIGRLGPEQDVELDLPRGGQWLLSSGDYDVAVADGGRSIRLSVLDGQARLVGPGTNLTTSAGSALVLQNGTVARVEDAVADEFVATWRPVAAQGAAPAGTRSNLRALAGAETLDATGTWRATAEFGPVWIPNNVPQDWSPYRYGHWRSVAPWGWTWIDDAPWGFVTSHYGRWARLQDGGEGADYWAWVPPRITSSEPAYAPALVNYIGTPGIGLSMPGNAGPAVAWFPLAPGEAYGPRRPGTDGKHVVLPSNYKNRSFATAVPRSVFTSGRSVASALVDLPEGRLLNAPLLLGSPEIAPPPPPGSVVAIGRPSIIRITAAPRTSLPAPRIGATGARTRMVLRAVAPKAARAKNAAMANASPHPSGATNRIVRTRAHVAAASRSAIR